MCGPATGHGVAQRFHRRHHARRSSARPVWAQGRGPLITVTREAIAVSDRRNNRLQLSMHDCSTHEMGKDAKATKRCRAAGEQALEASPPKQSRWPPAP